ncbi:MAG: RNA-guided endonuclease IscB [Dehalococcoidales bacterium]|nr:RNA-guided endonuclease IscB [Dehalococcoidales bacterium]
MVFVLDAHHRPLMPCTEKRARLLLQRGRAVVHHVAPFTIRLKDREVADCTFQPLRLKLDPGSKETGMAVLLEGDQGAKVVLLGEVIHKPGIKARLDARRALRRGRRSRHTRYRKPRFLNRHPEPCIVCGRNARHGHPTCDEHKGQRPDQPVARRLVPSLRACVDQTMNAAARIRAGLPVTALSVEHVRFDTQLLQDSGIAGTGYQQGTLAGYEVREYLLQKFGHRCAYCGGLSGDPVLEVEHTTPRSRGGSDRTSNLAIACRTCNQEKGDRTPEEWALALTGSRKEIDRVRMAGCARVREQAKAPLRDAALMNATRWAVLGRLRATGLPVETGTGARTKMQRIAHVLPKEHYYDALCVGESTPASFAALPAYGEVWRATGRGNRQMCGTDRNGFPIRHRARRKVHFGFQTGDLVAATIPAGKYAGTWRGRVLVRACGSFDIVVGGKRVVQGTSHRHCRMLQRSEGWQFEKRAVARDEEGASAFPPMAEARGTRAGGPG